MAKDGGGFQTPNPMGGGNKGDGGSTFGIPNSIINENNPTGPEAMVKNLASQTMPFQAAQRNNEAFNRGNIAIQQHTQQQADEKAAATKKAQDAEQQANQSAFNQANTLESALRDATLMKRRRSSGY